MNINLDIEGLYCRIASCSIMACLVRQTRCLRVSSPAKIYLSGRPFEPSAVWVQDFIGRLFGVADASRLPHLNFSPGSRKSRPLNAPAASSIKIQLVKPTANWHAVQVLSSLQMSPSRSG